MVKETEHAERTGLRTNPDGSNGGKYTPEGRRQQPHGDDESAENAPLELSGEGEHFIDFTA